MADLTLWDGSKYRNGRNCGKENRREDGLNVREEEKASVQL